jgi:hypothetical protein
MLLFMVALVSVALALGAFFLAFTRFCAAAPLRWPPRSPA